MIRHRMPIQMWSRRGVMVARFASIALASAPIESGFDERFGLAVGAVEHAFVLLQVCGFSQSLQPTVRYQVVTRNNLW